MIVLASTSVDSNFTLTVYLQNIKTLNITLIYFFSVGVIKKK